METCPVNFCWRVDGRAHPPKKIHPLNIGIAKLHGRLIKSKSLISGRQQSLKYQELSRAVA